MAKVKITIDIDNVTEQTLIKLDGGDDVHEVTIRQILRYSVQALLKATQEINKGKLLADAIILVQQAADDYEDQYICELTEEEEDEYWDEMTLLDTDIDEEDLDVIEQDMLEILEKYEDEDIDEADTNINPQHN